MLGCGSVCRGSVWDELAGNARIHLEPVLGPCLMQYHALKEFLKGKSDSERASDSGPAWIPGRGSVWEVSVGAAPRVWPVGRRRGCSCARELGVRGAGVGSATPTLHFQGQAGQPRRIFQEQKRSE